MRMPWEDDKNWDNTATTIVKGEPMSRTIKVNRIEIRRTVHDACHGLITDSDIAEKVYMRVMDYLEDYLSDCEEDGEENR